MKKNMSLERYLNSFVNLSKEDLILSNEKLILEYEFVKGNQIALEESLSYMVETSLEKVRTLLDDALNVFTHHLEGPNEKLIPQYIKKIDSIIKGKNVVKSGRTKMYDLNKLFNEIKKTSFGESNEVKQIQRLVVSDNLYYDNLPSILPFIYHIKDVSSSPEILEREAEKVYKDLESYHKRIKEVYTSFLKGKINCTIELENSEALEKIKSFLKDLKKVLTNFSSSDDNYKKYSKIIKELEKRKSNLDTKNELSPKESTMERMVLSKLIKVATLVQKEEEEAIALNFRLIDYYIEKIKEISK